MMNIKVFKQSKIQQWIMIIIFGLLILTLLVGKISMVQKLDRLRIYESTSFRVAKIALILYISYVLSKNYRR